jgi:hypothetical protein
MHFGNDAHPIISLQGCQPSSGGGEPYSGKSDETREHCIASFANLPRSAPLPLRPRFAAHSLSRLSESTAGLSDSGHAVDSDYVA